MSCVQSTCCIPVYHQWKIHLVKVEINFELMKYFFNVSEHMYKLIKRCLTEPLTLMQLVLLPFELAEIDCVERMLKASQIEFLLLHGQPPG